MPAIEDLATAFNSLGVWKGKQTVWGKQMHAKTFDRALYLLMHRIGQMGEREREIMDLLLKPGMNVVDVGANVGLYTLYMAGIVGPEGRVAAFEPDPDLVEILRKNCAENGATRIEVHNCALGEKADRLVLSRLTLNSGENHLGADSREAFRRPIEVDVARFDTLIPDMAPDFVKVDVQGWELNVLKGMESVLRSAKPLVYVELWPDGLERAGSSPLELFTFLGDVGLELYSCEDWKRLSESSFLEMATHSKGMDYVNLLASNGAPLTP
ncbi:MAG TPA: FkbM family methyltransferase [Opitutaceae bacterium]